MRFTLSSLPSSLLPSIHPHTNSCKHTSSLYFPAALFNPLLLPSIAFYPRSSILSTNTTYSSIQISHVRSNSSHSYCMAGSTSVPLPSASILVFLAARLLYESCIIQFPTSLLLNMPSLEHTQQTCDLLQ